MDTAALLDRLTPAIVGRRREVELVVAALGAARHVVLEGPPGTGKSSMLRAVAHELGIGFELVEGNAELTPARLVGHFDPALVLAEGYSPDNFVDGPLLAALRSGGLLYIEELNRVPEETLNVLVTVMSEREVTVPRLGRVVAEPGFRFVAAMNPFDSVGTARISAAISDRVCRVAVGYQTADDEGAIVRRHVADVDDGWLDRAVELAESAYGGEHLDTATFLYSLGDTIRMQDRQAEAIVVLERARVIYGRHYGPSHPDRIALDMVAGATLGELGRWPEAIAVLEGASAHVDALGDPRVRADLAAYLGQALWEGGGDRDRGVALVREAIALYPPIDRVMSDGLEQWLRERGRSP